MYVLEGRGEEEREGKGEGREGERRGGKGTGGEEHCICVCVKGEGYQDKSLSWSQTRHHPQHGSLSLSCVILEEIHICNG